MDSVGVRGAALFGDGFNDSLAQAMFSTMSPEVVAGGSGSGNFSMIDWMMEKADHFPIKMSLIFSICKCGSKFCHCSINN